MDSKIRETAISVDKHRKPKTKLGKTRKPYKTPKPTNCSFIGRMTVFAEELVLPITCNSSSTRQARCVCCATSKLKTRYFNCIRPSKTDTTPWTYLVHRTNVTRFIRRAIVEFSYKQVLELNSSEFNSKVVRRTCINSINTSVFLCICVFVIVSNTNQFRMNECLLFLAPLFLLSYFLFNFFLFLQKSEGGGRAKAPPAPPSARSL